MTADPSSDRAVQASRYARRRRQLFVVELGWTALFLIGVQALGWSHGIKAWALQQTVLAPAVIAIYVTVFSLLHILWSLPWDYYGGWVLEHRFDLSTQTLAAWVWKHGKQWAIGWVLFLVLVEGLYGCLAVSPRLWWAWATIGWVGFTVVLTRWMPVVLLPLFYRCEPLADAALSARLMRLVERCGLSAIGAYQINFSRDTRKANAALVGLGNTRRIVIADTLLNRFTPDEIETVLAHELGHHRLHHISWHVAVSSATTGCGLWLVHRSASWLLPQWGVDGLADIAGFPVVALFLFVLGLLILPLNNTFSRCMERQADEFALQVTRMTEPFIATMRKLADQNLAEIQPPRWVEWLLYDHPSIARRIQHARQFVAAQPEVHAG